MLVLGEMQVNYKMVCAMAILKCVSTFTDFTIY